MVTVVTWNRVPKYLILKILQFYKLLYIYINHYKIYIYIVKNYFFVNLSKIFSYRVVIYFREWLTWAKSRFSNSQLLENKGLFLSKNVTGQVVNWWLQSGYTVVAF